MTFDGPYLVLGSVKVKFKDFSPIWILLVIDGIAFCQFGL